jgi:1-deoxy-D-xylulose-5-phosphate synthase
MKPLDTELIADLGSRHDVLITAEEGGLGGFGSHVATFLASNGLLDGRVRFRPLMIPDHFVEHASQTDMYAEAGLDRAGIVATALTTLGYDEAAMAAALAKIS